MDFITRKQIAAKIADPAFIPVYRDLLAARGFPSTIRMAKPSELARALVYDALGHYSPEQIIAATKPTENPSVIQRQVQTVTEAVKPPKKASKFTEYPSINWKNLDNDIVRTADSIFTDRINCWSRLKELEVQLSGQEADQDVISEYITTSIRLELCFSELRSLNDTGAFIGKHPFIANRTERDRLEDLLRSDPLKFLEELKNIDGNIARYRSHLNSPKFTGDRKVKEAENLAKYEALKAMYQEIFKNRIQS